MLRVPAQEVRRVQWVAVIAVSGRLTLAWHRYPDAICGVLRIAHFSELDGTVLILILQSVLRVGPLTFGHQDALVGIIRVAKLIHLLWAVLGGASEDRVAVIVDGRALLRHPDAIVGVVGVEADPFVLERSHRAISKDRVPVLIISGLAAGWSPNTVLRVLREAELLELKALVIGAAVAKDRVAVLIISGLAAIGHPDAGFGVVREALQLHTRTGLSSLSEDRVSVLVVPGLTSGRYPNTVAWVIRVAHLLVARGLIGGVLAHYRIAISVGPGTRV